MAWHGAEDHPPLVRAGIEHAERCVPGTQEVPGRPHDLAQHDWEAQLAGHQSIGAQQPAQPSLTGQHVISAVHEHDQPARTGDRTSRTRAVQPNRRMRPDRQLTARPTAALNYPKINPRRVSS